MGGPVLVTGAAGFVGGAIVKRLALEGAAVRAAVRRPVAHWDSKVESSPIIELAPDSDWRAAIAGIDAVVHCAARVHVMSESSIDPLAEFRRINVAGTLNLALQAVDAGVRRFIFVSSIGVNGVETVDKAFTADDEAAPRSPYAISKHEAESALCRLGRDTAMEVVIVRPPLVIGPGAPGNFGQLLRAVYRGFPLPFGAVRNQRSLVAVENLADLVFTCLKHPEAAQRIFLVSNGEDLSTPELLRRTARSLGRPARLFPVPCRALRFAARMVGKGAVAQQLCGSLQVDIRKTRELLGWAPSTTVDEALERSARHFLAQIGPA